MAAGVSDVNISSDKKELVKIFFVIPSLHGGGAERVLTTLLRHLNREKFLPVLVLFQKSGPLLAELPINLRIVDLRKRGRLSFFNLVFSLARLIRKERPRIIFSMIWYTNVVAVLSKYLAVSKDVKVILSERIFPSADFKQLKGGAFRGLMTKVLYPCADLITVVSCKAKEDLVLNFNVPDRKIHVVYNPIDIEHIQTLASDPLDCSGFGDFSSPIVIGVGRLVEQKGFEYLIRAFALVRRKVQARLIIVGEGERREQLQKLIVQLGLSGDVFLSGFQENPYPWLAHSSIFVLSSIYEGFPNVILEAMALGIPVISTNCPSGPDEIIDDGKNGLLVPVGDEKALADAVLRIFQEDPLSKGLSIEAKTRTIDFNVHKIIRRYEEIFQSFNC